LPAFIYFLLNNFVLPKEFYDPHHRFPVMSYKNPEITELIREDSDEALLLSVLRRVYIMDDDPISAGASRARDLLSELASEGRDECRGSRESRKAQGKEGSGLSPIPALKLTDQGLVDAVKDDADEASELVFGRRRLPTLPSRRGNSPGRDSG
jgi:hypothetical protein